MVEKIQIHIAKVLKLLGASVDTPVTLTHPEDVTNGDFSTSVALAYAKKMQMKPCELAEKIVAELQKENMTHVERIEIAGPGFINFYFSRKFFSESVSEIFADKNFGKNKTRAGKKIMVEYTDPNPFKLFHIGHLMSNAIGEALARLIEYSGATVVRACYQGDVGLHVAKAMYGMLHLSEKEPYVSYLGDAYAFGSKAYEETPEAKKEIEILNKKIFDKSDATIQSLYDKGRKASLEQFEVIYKKLGTAFDRYYFESEVADTGLSLVKEFLTQNVFEISEGAVVFRGDKHGLHTRVFINSQGLPTYETKELGLTRRKFAEENPDLSIVITANEQSAYFHVVLEAMRHIDTNMAERTRHIAHGMLRLPSGKMSSRTGDVITGESLLASVEAMVHQKLEARELETHEKSRIAEQVAVGAIKYSILRQATGGDIIFDFEKSISFEGDSGPYLQYSYVRANSIITKAKEEGILAWEAKHPTPPDVSLLERMLPRFPEIVLRAGTEYAPHLVVTYLIELSSAWNSYYAHNQIVNKEDSHSPYKVALAQAFAVVMKKGLTLLGIPAPERM